MTTPLSISCPSCGSSLKIKDLSALQGRSWLLVSLADGSNPKIKDYSLIGKKIPCPTCKVPFQIAVHVESAPVDGLVAPKKREFWESRDPQRVETRLWICPWCGKECQIPADEPDPFSCDECRAAAPQKQPLRPESFYSKHPTFCLAAVVFGLLSFACCLVPSTGTRFGATPNVGDKVKINTEMWLSVDEAAQDESLQLTTAKDAIGLRVMEMRGRIFVVPAGTEGLLLEGGVFTSRVRIMSGNHYGKAGYLPSEFVRKQ